MKSDREKPSSATVIMQTKQWVKLVVIKNDFCPFVKKYFDADRIRYQVNTATNAEESLSILAAEYKTLDDDQSIETSLVIYPQSLEDFAHYLDFLALAQERLLALDYEGIYQIASFHPCYCFAGARDQDAENYTNRSPYPMIHILREHSLEKALESYPNPENIPERNIALSEEIGLEQLKEDLYQCY